jgi:hypothetical protein
VTRPVAEILAEAQENNWPTSSIDAMANHHLCGGRTRDVNDINDFTGHAATRGGAGSAEHVLDAASSVREGAASTSIEGALSGQASA